MTVDNLTSKNSQLKPTFRETSKPTAILAVAGFSRSVGNLAASPPLLDFSNKVIDLESSFAEVFQNKVRRASQFVKFSNLAAAQCAQFVDPGFLKSSRVGFFLGTGIGNTSDIVAFTAEILANYTKSISPTCFVNTVSNAGLFYAARLLQIECSTVVVSQESISFEAALLTAKYTLQRGDIDLAFVGGVDVLHPPNETACARLGSAGADIDNLGEGSAFVALANVPPPGAQVLGYLNSVNIERAPPAAILANSGHTTDLLSYGIDHQVSSLESAARELNLQPYPYRQWSGDYSTGAAIGLGRFISDPDMTQRNLWHVNCHHHGFIGYFCVSKS